MARLCPFCKSSKLMVKAGYTWDKHGPHQRWMCRNKSCGRFTIKPLKEKH
jgi:transposase-like protein